MYCTHCGKEIRDGAVFCNWCGSRQEENQVNREVMQNPVQQMNSNISGMSDNVDKENTMRMILQHDNTRRSLKPTMICAFVLAVFFFAMTPLVRSGGAFFIVLGILGVVFGSLCLYKYTELSKRIEELKEGLKRK